MIWILVMVNFLLTAVLGACLWYTDNLMKQVALRFDEIETLWRRSEHVYEVLGKLVGEEDVDEAKRMVKETADLAASFAKDSVDWRKECELLTELLSEVKEELGKCEGCLPTGETWAATRDGVLTYVRDVVAACNHYASKAPGRLVRELREKCRSALIQFWEAPNGRSSGFRCAMCGASGEEPEDIEHSVTCLFAYENPSKPERGVG